MVLISTARSSSSSPGCSTAKKSRQAGSQAWGSAMLGGCPEPGHWGAWETQSSANSWPGVGLKAWGSATLNIAKKKRKCI